jgi:hypothetical protein
MKTKQIIFIAFLIITTTSFAQDAKKMAKFLTVTPTVDYDKTVSMFFDRKNPEKHGFEDISAMFKNAFVAEKFTVKEDPRYLLVMDYDYGYVISGYRFQYSNLTAEVLDLKNNRTIVATIIYKGRFEIDALANALAAELSKTVVPENSSVKETETPKTAPTKTATKTKEERLVELKGLYEKELITKDEYEAQKKKILDE